MSIQFSATYLAQGHSAHIFVWRSWRPDADTRGKGARRARKCSFVSALFRAENLARNGTLVEGFVLAVLCVYVLVIVVVDAGARNDHVSRGQYVDEWSYHLISFQ